MNSGMENEVKVVSWEKLGISNDFLFGKILKDTSMPFGVIVI